MSRQKFLIIILLITAVSFLVIIYQSKTVDLTPHDIIDKTIYQNETVNIAYYNFIDKLSLEDQQVICPEGEEDPEIVRQCQKEASKAGGSGMFCSIFCDDIIRYSQNEDALYNEVVEFKEWGEDPSRRKRLYLIRIALAFRFGGEPLAFKVCDNLTIPSEREECKNRVKAIKK